MPDSFDVFHGLTWSSMHGAFQQFGELELTIVSPNGHLLVLEVKAGVVFTQDGQLLKNYGSDGAKDDLLVESVYRFKGQSAPAVVLCEVDLEDLSILDARKLFVGMTRGQVRVEFVTSERAAKVLVQKNKINN